ncbi:SAM-dependent methyltransferase [Actinosynnema sp. ALI-1.44]|uniref:class I SAM-dependent methyltransferase n=1 Tax=Actinosynnema sp. ALI-1.44 TaxID=1933779 RepID=UPI00097C6307|nr:methyltransferase domain-containing protein [Actinosynnema sp. ALI-1.44]ONI86386.1 SAM-dependent methyltransferase [Actinosynnema sp. ALI-1.44]
MHLAHEEELLRSDVVANRSMNRTRPLTGRDSYRTALAFDIVAHQPATWLDLCCGSGKALIDAAALLPGTAITGLDLVDQFTTATAATVDLVAAPVSAWQPEHRYDLITCVHGMHYIGDKLGTLTRAVQWLAPKGVFVANFDATAVRDRDGNPLNVTKALRAADFDYNARTRRIRKIGPDTTPFPWRYLGADKSAGPNYTGQPAVDSYYGSHG